MNATATKIRQKIFNKDNFHFEEVALELFQFQHSYNPVYRQFCDYMHIDIKKIQKVEQIPFLPIEFFKTHQVCIENTVAQKRFESSGTTGQETSKHDVADVSLYAESYLAGFKQFYGDPQDWTILALLPSYLERDTSSLVYMVDDLIKKSKNPNSGFYLNNLEELAKAVDSRPSTVDRGQKILLIGVTFALLDFAEQFPMAIPDVVIMETGGMKGRRAEMTRDEVHAQLKTAFQVEHIHSEYGMTELLSQAYSKGDGIFETPHCMNVLKRDIYDPMNVSSTPGRGGLNVIDLANIYSCAFIATQDIVQLLPEQKFELFGRLDYADMRGCNLMVSL